MSGQIRTLCSAAAIVAAVSIAPGCGKQDPPTLREAEAWADEWLSSIEQSLEMSAADPATDESDEDPDAADGGEPGNWNVPEALRDCFVDDNWKPEGFKNPTQAINWLTSAAWHVGKLQSIDLVDGAGEIVFTLEGSGDPTVSATITLEDGFAKCSALKVSGEQNSEGAK